MFRLKQGVELTYVQGIGCDMVVIISSQLRNVAATAHVLLASNQNVKARYIAMMSSVQCIAGLM